MSPKELDGYLRVVQRIFNQDDRTGIPLLVSYLDHGDDRLAWAAAWALNRVYSPEATNPLIEALTRYDIDLAVFARMRGEPQVERLIDLLKAEERGARIRSAEALAVTCDERAIEPLRRVLSYWPLDSYYGLARSVLRRGFRPLVDDILFKCLHQLSPPEAWMCFSKVDDPTIKARVKEYLDAEDPLVRERAMAMLREDFIPPPFVLLSPRANRSILADLESKKPWECVESAKVLALMDSVPVSYVPALIEALDVWSQGWEFPPTAAIAVALGKTGAAEGLPHLLAYFDEPYLVKAGALGLEELIRRSASLLDLKELVKVADLPEFALHRYEYYGPGYIECKKIEVIDVSSIKKLARAELERRKASCE